MKRQLRWMIEEFDSEFGLSPAYKKKLLGIVSRDTSDRIASGLTLLALKAFPSSELQQFLQRLREEAQS